MSTEQSYVGKGDSTTSPLPTASEAAQPLSPTDERRDYFLTLAQHPGTTEYLMSLLNILEEFNDSTDPIPLLTELSQSYLTHPYYEPTPERISQLDQMLCLIRTLSELRTHYTCFAIESLGAQAQQEGLDND